MTISIDGLNKAAVLAALYNAAFPQSFGAIFGNPKPMTIAEAQVILDTTDDHYFDYLNGRALKIDLNTQELDTWLFNRDHGDNATEQVIAALRTQEPTL